MNTLEVNKYLKHYKKFKGTYPRDLLPNNIPKYCGVIVNTDDSSNAGQHWVSIYNGDVAIYFDSFGLPPLHKEIIKFLDNISPVGWCYNSVTFQGMTSETCGMYCVYFLINHFNGGKFENFHVIFNQNKKINDIMVESLYKLKI